MPSQEEAIIEDERPGITRWVLPVLLMLASLGALVYFLAPYRSSVQAALRHASVGSLVVLTALSCGALLLRTEAWRVGLAAAGRHPRPTHLHAANGGTFLVMLVNHYLAPWVKILLLRRMEGPSSAQILQLWAIDVAGTILEVFAVAGLLIFASLRVALPWWVPVLIIAGAIALTVVASVLHRRYRDHAVVQGLNVLLRPHYRWRVIAVFAAVFGVQILRTWLALRAVGLHLDIGDAVLVFVVGGVLGALPSGIVAAPIAASLLVLHSHGVGVAAASGVLLTATLAIGTVLYALVAGLAYWREARRPQPETAGEATAPAVEAR